MGHRIVPLSRVKQPKKICPDKINILFFLVNEYLVVNPQNFTSASSRGLECTSLGPYIMSCGG